MKIVSETSDKELARQRVQPIVEWALKDLAANLMRITRGAGKPYLVGRQAQELIEALKAYREAVGLYPGSDEISAALNIQEDLRLSGQLSRSENSRRYAKEMLVRGGLQIAASRLLGQSTQESAGSSELYQGFMDLRDVQDEDRSERMDASASTKTKPRARAKRVPRPKA